MLSTHTKKHMCLSHLPHLACLLVGDDAGHLGIHLFKRAIRLKEHTGGLGSCTRARGKCRREKLCLVENFGAAQVTRFPRPYPRPPFNFMCSLLRVLCLSLPGRAPGFCTAPLLKKNPAHAPATGLSGAAMRETTRVLGALTGTDFVASLLLPNCIFPASILLAMFEQKRK